MYFHMVMGKAGRISLWPEIFDSMKYDDCEVIGFMSFCSLHIWFIKRLTVLIKWFLEGVTLECGVISKYVKSIPAE